MDVSGNLMRMARTCKARHKSYGDSPIRHGAMLAALHPSGVRLRTPHEHDVFALWVALTGKLVRFAVSGFTHQDSIHDAAVYAAMLEGKVQEGKQ